MFDVAVDPAISEQEWERSIDDPFSASALGVLHHLTTHNTAQHTAEQQAGREEEKGEQAEERVEKTEEGSDGLIAIAVDAAAVAALVPSSAVSPSSSHPRASIYGEDDEGAHSQDDRPVAVLNTSVRSRMTAGRVVAARQSATAALPQPRMKVNLARAENWLHAGRDKGAEQQEERKEPKADDTELSYGGSEQTSTSFEAAGLGGFTTGSSRPVSVSAASMERARRLLAEADEEYNSQHDGRGSEGATTLRSAQRVGKQQPAQSNSQRRPLTSPAAAASATPSSTAYSHNAPALAPSSLRTPARFSRPASPSVADTTPLASHWSAQQSYERTSADGGVAADSTAMDGFATGSGRRVTVSESSLKRAYQLVREADEEEASRQRQSGSEPGGATEALQFKSLRSHQQQSPTVLAASASSSTFQPAASSPGSFRPPASSFRAPARLTPRQQPPQLASSTAAVTNPSAPTARQIKWKAAEVPPPRDTKQAESPHKLSKSAEFELWLKQAALEEADGSDLGDSSLLAPQFEESDERSAMAHHSAASAMLTFDEDADTAALFSLPSTESSAFTSSPDSAATLTSTSTASASSRSTFLPTPDSPHAASLEGFGGFKTGANAPISLRPASLLRAQQLIADAQHAQQRDKHDEHEQEYAEREGGLQGREEQKSDEAMSFGFVTGRGKQAAAIRPESLLRAQALIADAQQQQQQQHDDVEQSTGDEPMPGGFMTGGGKKTAALRPESVLRAQQLLAEADVSGQQRHGDGSDSSKGKGGDGEARRVMRSSHESRPPLAALPINTLHASGNRGAAARDDDKPLLARRQVGKRVNDRAALDLQRSPLADSPLPSPVTALLPAVDSKVTVGKRDAAVPSKKRKLTFNTPRTVAPGARRSGKQAKQGEDDGEQPNLLAVKGQHQPSTPKGKLAGLPALARPSMPPAPLLLPPTDVLQFSLRQQRVERWTRDELLGLGVAAAVVDMTSCDALSHAFLHSSPSQSQPDSGSVEAAQHYSATTAYFHLLDGGCDRSLLSPMWVRNHYRWIVWKLACIERSFATQLQGRCCTYYQVMAQLRKRYGVELEQAKRPALAKLLEQDESAARYMVLCVAAILPAQASTSIPVSSHEGGSRAGDESAAVDAADDADPDTTLLLHRKQYGVCHVELTDGWYSVAAKLDAPLLQLLQRGRITVGDKLRVFNASLAGASDACTPLENENVYLELHANSTRRAHTSCRLGVQRTATFSVSLASVREGGGAIPCMHAAVGRVYPSMYMEVMEEGVKAHRNQRAEDARQEQWERRVEKEMELKRDEWEKRMEQSNARSNQQPSQRTTQSTQSQVSQAQYGDAALAAEAMELEPPEPRRLVPYLKVRLYEIVPPSASIAFADDESSRMADGGAAASAVLTGAECTFTVWRPTEDDMHNLSEGSVVSIYSAQVAGRHDGILRLSSSRSTPIVTNACIAPLTSLFRQPCSFPQLHSLQRSDEFDIAVCVVYEQCYSGRGVFSSEMQHTRQLYCCYDSDELLMIDVREDDTQLHFTAGQPLRAPTTLLATNLRYSGYDATHRVHTAQSSASAAFVTKAAGGTERQAAEKGSAARQQLAVGWKQCRQFFSSDSGKSVAALHRQRAVALVEGLADRQLSALKQSAQVGSDGWFDTLLRAIAAAQTEAASAKGQV